MRSASSWGAQESLGTLSRQSRGPWVRVREGKSSLALILGNFRILVLISPILWPLHCLISFPQWLCVSTFLRYSNGHAQNLSLPITIEQNGSLCSNPRRRQWQKKKIPVFPFRVDMSPDCRQGFKQFKTPIKFQRREENPGVLIHTDAVQLSQGLPFPSVYRKVSGIHTHESYLPVNFPSWGKGSGHSLAQRQKLNLELMHL